MTPLLSFKEAMELQNPEPMYGVRDNTIEVRDNSITAARLAIIDRTWHADYVLVQDILIWVTYITDIERAITKTRRTSVKMIDRILGQFDE